MIVTWGSVTPGSVDPKKARRRSSGRQAAPDGRFIRGYSGNPAVRPPGSRGPAAQLALELIAGNVEAVTRKILDRALEGDRLLLKLCLDRVLGPVRGRPVEVTLDFTPDDYGLVASLEQLLMATRGGELTPDEALRLTAVLKLRNERARCLEWEDGTELWEDSPAAAKEAPDIS
jgi:hypothetical protein